MRGFGTKAASRSINSCGSKRIARVPSCQARRIFKRTFPSAVSSSASWAIGGRKTYLQRCSSLCLSPAGTATPA